MCATRRRTGWLMHIDGPLIATLGTMGLFASFLIAVLWIIQRQLVYFPLARRTNSKNRPRANR